MFGPILHVYRYERRVSFELAAGLLPRGAMVSRSRVHSRLNGFRSQVQTLVPGG